MNEGFRLGVWSSFVRGLGFVAFYLAWGVNPATLKPLNPPILTN